MILNPSIPKVKIRQNFEFFFCKMLENIAPGECYSEDYKTFQLKGHNARDSKSQNHLVVVQFEKRSRY